VVSGAYCVRSVSVFLLDRFPKTRRVSCAVSSTGCLLEMTTAVVLVICLMLWLSMESDEEE